MMEPGLGLSSVSKITIFFFNQNGISHWMKMKTHLLSSRTYHRGRHTNKRLPCLIFSLTSSAQKRSAKVPTVASKFLHDLVTQSFRIFTLSLIISALTHFPAILHFFSLSEWTSLLWACLIINYYLTWGSQLKYNFLKNPFQTYKSKLVLAFLFPHITLYFFMLWPRFVIKCLLWLLSAPQ